MPQPTPTLNGQIFYVPGYPEIYWIDNGLARHISDEDTYHGVFGPHGVFGVPPNKQAYSELLTQVTVGPPVAHGTMLARAGNDAKIYFVENDTKRWIPTESIKARFQLNGNVHSLPLATVNSFANGPDFVDPGGPPTLRSILVAKVGSPASTTITVKGSGFTPNSVIVIRVTPKNLQHMAQFSTFAGPDGTFVISDTFVCVGGIGLTVTAFEDADPPNTEAQAPDITC